MPGKFLAEFELYVMLAIAQKGDDADGALVREEMTRRPVDRRAVCDAGAPGVEGPHHPAYRTPDCRPAWPCPPILPAHDARRRGPAAPHGDAGAVMQD